MEQVNEAWDLIRILYDMPMQERCETFGYMEIPEIAKTYAFVEAKAIYEMHQSWRKMKKA